MPSNEALSLAGWNTKKGASIRFGKLPLIIRFANDCPKRVTPTSNKRCYNAYRDLGARRETLNLLLSVKRSKGHLRLPAIILPSLEGYMPPR